MAAFLQRIGWLELGSQRRRSHSGALWGCVLESKLFALTVRLHDSIPETDVLFFIRESNLSHGHWSNILPSTFIPFSQFVLLLLWIMEFLLAPTEVPDKVKAVHTLAFLSSCTCVDKSVKLSVVFRDPTRASKDKPVFAVSLILVSTASWYSRSFSYIHSASIITIEMDWKERMNKCFSWLFEHSCFWLLSRSSSEVLFILSALYNFEYT